MTKDRPRPGDVIRVSDTFQSGYSYRLSAKYGDVTSEAFSPRFSPAEMLELGVFEGKYITDCRGEFPGYWFEGAKLSADPDPGVNCFGIKSRQSLDIWKSKGWIVDPDPRGWFQWYCRYYMGRRLPGVDDFQIRRWRGFSRHAGQIRKNCDPGDVFCRPKQRQALLQWSHDPFI